MYFILSLFNWQPNRLTKAQLPTGMAQINKSKILSLEVPTYLII